jgi:hypothetical protein
VRHRTALERGAPTNEPVTSSLKERCERRVSERPTTISDDVPAFKVDRIVGDASPAPDHRRPTNLAASCQRHRRVPARIELSRIAQTLDVRLEPATAAFQQHHIEPII